MLGKGVDEKKFTVVGGIAGGVMDNATVLNCYNKGNVTGKGKTVGGIAAVSFGKIENSTNFGTIIGEEENIGGIVGQKIGIIKNSSNKGNVMGEKSNIGGIAGTTSSNTSILNSTNSGYVLGKGMNEKKFAKVGGIVGLISKETSILNCINKGNVTGKNNIGGITGIIHNVTIEKCYNSGKIEGLFQLGGICGQIGTECDAHIKNCYNKGEVIATQNNSDYDIGGIIGWVSVTNTSGSIVNNYNIGTVKSPQTVNVGGIIGRILPESIATFKIENNYYNKEIVTQTDSSYTGAEKEGKTTDEMKQQIFVDLLNQQISEEQIWKKDEENKNDGYPILIGVE